MHCGFATVQTRKAKDVSKELERQEAMIDSMNGMLDIMVIQGEVLGRVEASLTELKEWLQTPPSSDLPDLLLGLKTSMDAMHAEMQRLPARIVQAMRSHEFDGPG